MGEAIQIKDFLFCAEHNRIICRLGSSFLKET